MLAAEGDRELLVHHLHDLLGGRDALHDLLGQGPDADAIEQVIHHIDRDVGLEQGRADLPERVLHLFRVELAPRTKLLEDTVQTVAQCVEHIEESPGSRSRMGAVAA